MGCLLSLLNAALLLVAVEVVVLLHAEEDAAVARRFGALVTRESAAVEVANAIVLDGPEVLDVVTSS